MRKIFNSAAVLVKMCYASVKLKNNNKKTVWSFTNTVRYLGTFWLPIRFQTCSFITTSLLLDIIKTKSYFENQVSSRLLKRKGKTRDYSPYSNLFHVSLLCSLHHEWYRLCATLHLFDPAGGELMCWSIRTARLHLRDGPLLLKQLFQPAPTAARLS